MNTNFFDSSAKNLKNLYLQKEELIKLTEQGDPLAIFKLCWMCIMYNNEKEALNLFPKISPGEEKDFLGQLLVNHYHCRALMMKKLKQKDFNGKKMLQLAKDLSNLEPDPKVGITLGASLIVKNEENFLEECLKSLPPILDEIVIVDTGSTDRTLTIAEKYNAKIGHFKWCNDFSSARNAALKLNTAHWILWIDADERLDAKSYPYLYEGLIRPQWGGYTLNIINHLSEKEKNSQWVHCPIRIFQRLEGICLTGAIHEQVGPSIEEQGYGVMYLNNVNLHHYGYTDQMIVERDKESRTLSIVNEEIRNAPTNPFHWYNLASIYSVQQKWLECADAAEKAVHFLFDWPPYVPILYSTWSEALFSLGEMEKALRVCKEFEEKDEIVHPMIEYSKARIYFKLTRFDEALRSIDRCLDADWKRKVEGDKGILYYKAPCVKGKILNSLGRFEEGLEVLNKTLQAEPDFQDAKYHRGVAHFYLHHYSEALRDFLIARKNSSYQIEACLLGAECSFKLQQPKEAIKLLLEVPEDFTLPESLFSQWLMHASSEIPLDKLKKRFEQILDPSIDLELNYARVLSAYGEETLAESQFLSILKTDPTYANAWFNLGDLYFKQERFKEALEIYKKGLVHQDNILDAWINLGNCYAYLEDIPSSIHCYEEVLKRSPEHVAAGQNLKVLKDLEKDICI